MKQRLIAIVLTVALLLSLCGCTAMTQRGLELLQEMDEKAIAMDNQPQQSGELPAYDELVYERPDPDELWAAGIAFASVVRAGGSNIRRMRASMILEMNRAVLCRIIHC